MDIIPLPRPVIFLEFFVREAIFQGKGTVRTSLPSDAFFYTEESKAKSYSYWQKTSRSAQDMGVDRWQKKQPATLPRLLSFIDERPVISPAAIDRAQEWFTPDVAAVVCIGEEFLHEGEWFRSPDSVVTHRYTGEHDCFRYANMDDIFPYGAFGSMLDVDADGVIWRSGGMAFPKKVITPGETFCYLSRRVETGRRKPNLNLVMFVKNYGLHTSVGCVTTQEAEGHDSSHLCREPFVLKDGRVHQQV
ncbi:hypothetical protein SOASR030_01130 [Leminorella grimontii]|uniref:Uncharacterized protein n=1 Tax=Leminorella grimontii TaxID=82981 RepID=A0AAV5MZQ8_9GAMM|nr:hypothetical protein [Leminorella grimontii]KFC95431.1 hypothetical protein GLGR_1972 [Leminorella grimontii ATCC 33999 = DSM 5078]GKX54001.1 hypothetical protein SOASR030_01130 [Leminorella grimontii]VFS60345.1 Uncharacterised protein [Leminorella grimontii]